MHYIKTQEPNLLGGFIHVPCLPDQRPNKHDNMPLETSVRGLEIIIEESLNKWEYKQENS